MADIRWDRPEPEPVGNWAGVGRSALWALPHLVGVRPPEDLANWQSDHRLLAFLSEVAPTLVPYIGWAKAAKAIGPLARAASWAVPDATLAARPFLGAAGREVMNFLPFEAGRLGAGALGGQALAQALGGEYGGTGNLAASTGFDLALLGLGAGVGGLLGAGGKSEIPFPGMPGQDLSAVPTANYRRFLDLQNAGRVEPEWTGPAERKYVQQIREELGPVTGDLQVPDVGLRTQKEISAFDRVSNRLAKMFAPTRVAGRQVRQLLVGKTGFADGTTLQDFSQRAGLSIDELAEMQYPRAIELTAPKSAENFDKVLAGFTKLELPNSRTVWVKASGEGDEGLHTFLRQVPGGKNPEWVVFQSKNPELFTGKQSLPDINAGGTLDPLALMELGRKVTHAVPEAGQRYAADGTIDRLFKPSPNRDIRTKLLVAGQRGFRTQEDIAAFEQQAGLGQGWLQNVRFPRVWEAQSEHAAKKIDGILSHFSSVGDGWKMLYDSADGAVLMAKMVRPGQALLFKTDRPEAFAKGAQNWLSGQVDATMRVFGKADVLTKATGNELIDTVAARMAGRATMDLRGVRPEKPGWVFRLMRQIVPSGSSSETKRRAFAWINKELVPLEFQFKKNPEALRIVLAIKEAETEAAGQAQRLALGSGSLAAVNDAKLSPLGLLWQQMPPEAGSVLDYVINKLSLEELDKMLTVLNAGENLGEAVKKYGLSPNTVAALTKMLDNDAWQVQQIARAEKFGKIEKSKQLAPRMDHFGWNRLYKGDLRVPLFGKSGLVGWFGGNNAKEALAAAEAGRVALLAEGVETSVGRVTNVADSSDLEMLGKMAFDPDFKRIQAILAKGVGVSRPGTFNPRTGLIGYRTEFTRQELADAIVKHYERNARYQAEIGVKQMVAKQFDALGKRDPVLADTVQRRMDLLRGKKGSIGESVDKNADLVLNRVLGNQSASKIVSGINGAMHRLQFGFWNAGYIASNLLNFVQTGLPHIAFLTTAPAERLVNEYGHTFVRGRPVWAWDVMKSVGRSFTLMGSKDPDLMEAVVRGAQEGVWRPKFIEEFVGEHSITKQRLAAALKGQEPMSEVLRALVDASGVGSEMFSRMHAFALGWDVFGRLLGVADKDLRYQLAKRFVEKTMFGYSQGDRAAIMTGPLGNLWGLWKNWPIHYLGWMLQYAGEGVKYGNWKPLLWMMTGTGVLGGAGALPFVGTYNAISGWMGNEGAMGQIYDAFGGADGTGHGLADTVWYGVPSLLGITLQNQLASLLNDPASDATRFVGVAAIDRAAWLGKAIGEGWDKAWATGQNPLADQRTRDLLAKALAPNTLLRLANAVADTSYKSVATGQPLVRWTTGERVLHSLGFSPTEMATEMEINRVVWQSKDKMTERVQSLGAAMADALGNGDGRTVERIVRIAVSESVDPGRVLKSATMRMNRGQSTAMEEGIQTQEGQRWLARGFGLR